MRVVKRHLLARNLTDRIALRVTGCQGFCQMDPSIVVEPGNHLYPKLKMEHVPRIIEATLGGFVAEELIYREPRDGRMFLGLGEIPFFKKQTRTLLAGNQKIDPIRIHDYLEQDGYSALEKVLLAGDPAAVVEEVKASGLRGRGGAGFPTGLKWERARASGNGHGVKYMVCNCDEGDPGAYMDRSLLEGNPHAIIEGMLIAAYAIGASRGILYVRSEYPLAIKHSVIALGQARALGLLGKDVLGTGFEFDIEIVRGAGAFVCGEETALIRSVMGYAGEPRQRPPYPIQKGIENRPTCINNVETLANVPVIVRNGAAAFAKVGLPGNTGTKIFSVVGKIRNTGLVEVPLGTTIREVVHDIGGGAPGKGRVKAVQTGGPSGGCIPASLFDLPIDYDSLAQAGSIMGSGGMIVMDDHTCMVDVAKYFMKFLKDESCGKCFTCRKGTQRMWEILDDVTAGRATPRPARPPQGARRGRQGHVDVRARPERAEPRPLDPALLPRRVRGARRPEAVPRLRLRRARRRAVPDRLPPRHGGVAVRRPHRPGRERPRLPGDPRGESLPVGLRAGLQPPVRGALPRRDDRGRGRRDPRPQALRHGPGGPALLPAEADAHRARERAAASPSSAAGRPASRRRTTSPCAATGSPPSTPSRSRAGCSSPRSRRTASRTTSCRRRSPRSSTRTSR